MSSVLLLKRNQPSNSVAIRCSLLLRDVIARISIFGSSVVIAFIGNLILCKTPLAVNQSSSVRSFESISMFPVAPNLESVYTEVIVSGFVRLYANNWSL